MQGIGRDTSVLSSLQERLAEAEQTNGDLLAYARGHAGAVNAIHEATLAALEATNPACFASIVTHDWPALLGVDAVALAWSADGRAFAADRTGLRKMEPRLVVRMAGMDKAVTVREVERGHPLFGPGADPIRAEILIRLAGARGIGLLLLGEEATTAIEPPAATRLLRFLGRTASIMLERWTLT